MDKVSSVERLRLDIWLDIACVCKTRSAAKLACQGGKVTVNGDRARPHRHISAGDKVIITEINGRKRHLLVSSLTERRIKKVEAKKTIKVMTWNIRFGVARLDFFGDGCGDLKTGGK